MTATCLLMLFARNGSHIDSVPLTSEPSDAGVRAIINDFSSARSANMLLRDPIGRSWMVAHRTVTL